MKTINYKNKVILILLSFFILKIQAQRLNIDSIKTVLNTAKQDTNRVNSLNELSMQLDKMNKNDDALVYAIEAKNLAQKLNFKKGLSKAYGIIGVNYYHTNKLSKSLQNHFEALKMRKEMGDKKSISFSYNAIGAVYYKSGHYSDAVNNFYESLKIAQEINDSTALAYSYNNIGAIYFDQHNYKEALKNYSASLRIKEKLGDKKDIARSFRNIGNLYDALGDETEALKNYILSLNLRKEIRDSVGLAEAYLNVGVFYRKKRNLKEALKNCFISLKIDELIGDIRGLGYSYYEIGGIYFDKKNYGLAKEYCHKALEIAKNSQDLHFLMNINKSLSDIYSNIGVYEKAFSFHKAFILVKDSLYNEKNEKKIVQTQMQYDFDSQQMADSIKNAENIKHQKVKSEEKLKQQRLYTYGGIFGIFLMVIVAGVSFRAYRQKQKANGLLAEKNSMIESQKALVEGKQKEILDSIHYAKRIQQALLPTQKYIENSIKLLNKRNRS